MILEKCIFMIIFNKVNLDIFVSFKIYTITFWIMNETSYHDEKRQISFHRSKWNWFAQKLEMPVLSRRICSTTSGKDNFVKFILLQINKGLTHDANNDYLAIVQNEICQTNDQGLYPIRCITHGRWKPSN